MNGKVGKVSYFIVFERRGRRVRVSTERFKAHTVSSDLLSVVVVLGSWRVLIQKRMDDAIYSSATLKKHPACSGVELAFIRRASLRERSRAHR
jgi:hypothetical protein